MGPCTNDVSLIFGIFDPLPPPISNLAQSIVLINLCYIKLYFHVISDSVIGISIVSIFIFWLYQVSVYSTLFSVISTSILANCVNQIPLYQRPCTKYGHTSPLELLRIGAKEMSETVQKKSRFPSM